MRRKSVFTLIILGMVLTLVLGISIGLMADRHQQAEKKQKILVFGKLSLNPTADAELAEKLLIEKLLPASKGVDGLKMTALKKMTMPQRGNSQAPETSQPDFVMMAEISDVTVLAKLLGQTPGALKEFGDEMKVQAGAPEFELYTILGTNEQ